jgi:hypothetical protein
VISDVIINGDEASPPNYGQPAAIRVVGAFLVVSTACTIGVVDAIWRILAAITPIGVGDAVGVIRVGIQVAAILALAIEQLWAAAVAVGVVKCVRRLWWCLGQVGVGAQVAQIGLGRDVGGKGDGHDSQGDQKFFHEEPAGYC